MTFNKDYLDEVSFGGGRGDVVSGPDRFREEGKNGLEDRVVVTRICGRNVGAANFDHRQHFCGRIITTYNA